MDSKKISTTILIVLVLCPSLLFAEWSAPITFIKGKWGKSNDEFGITYQDTDTWYPSFYVTSKGKIVVKDGANKRIKVYNDMGKLDSIIPYRVGRSYKELTLADSYGFLGDFIGYSKEGGNYYYRSDQKVFILFSDTGKLIKTYTERPIELGIRREKKISDNTYEITLSFPDREWKIVCEHGCWAFQRDMNDNIFCISYDEIWRYNNKGAEVGRLKTPPDAYGQTNITHVVSFAGDVYKRQWSSDEYSIIKWSWNNDK